MKSNKNDMGLHELIHKINQFIHKIRDDMKNWGREQWIMVILSGVLILIILIPIENKSDKNISQEEKLNSQQSTTQHNAMQHNATQEIWGNENNMDDSGVMQHNAMQHNAMQEGTNDYDDINQNTLSGEMKELEERVQKILSQVEGAGRVSVMITYEAGEEKVVEKDVPITRDNLSEADASGGTRSSLQLSETESTVFISDGTGRQIPMITKSIAPSVRGIVIVAEGGGNKFVVKNLTEAAEALFQIDSHKIKVMKMKIQE